MSKLGGGLPKGQANGIADLDAQLVSDPARPHVIIAVVDVAKITEDVDTGEREPTLRIRRLERVLPGDAAAAEQLMRHAVDRRLGAEQLPIDLEDEITAIFKEASIDDNGIMLYPDSDTDPEPERGDR